MKKEPESIRKVLSSNIKKYRGILQYTQEILAEEAGLSAQTVNDIEGHRRWVSPNTLSKLAKALNICEYQLLVPESTDFDEKTNDFSPQLLISLQKRIQKSIDNHFEEMLVSKNK